MQGLTAAHDGASSLALMARGLPEVEAIAEDDQVTGKIFESFCGMEIVKHAAWSEAQPDIYHYRDGRDEIDLVVEARSGEIACLEMKAAASVAPSDFAAMVKLRDRIGDRFSSGVVIYTGARTVPLGDRIWAVPVSGLCTD